MTDIATSQPYAGTRWRVGNHAAGSAAAFTASGTALDPGTATLTIRAPGGTLTTYVWPTPGTADGTLVREATGRFYADITWDAGGLWWAELRGTGAVVATTELGIVVQPREWTL